MIYLVCCGVICVCVYEVEVTTEPGLPGLMPKYAFIYSCLDGEEPEVNITTLPPPTPIENGKHKECT